MDDVLFQLKVHLFWWHFFLFFFSGVISLVFLHVLGRWYVKSLIIERELEKIKQKQEEGD